MQEKDLEKKFREMVRQEGGRAYKFVSPGNSGVPDRLVVLPEGHIGFVELKRKGRVPTKLQEMQMEFLGSMGFYVRVLDRAGDIEQVIQEIRKTGAGHGI